MPVLQYEDTSIATAIEPALPGAKTCRVMVGGPDNQPRICGRKVAVVNDWTYECPEHGEMH